MRQLMQSEGISPDLVYVSSARRTVETLQALQPWDRPPIVEVREGLYHALPSSIFELLNNVPDSARSVLLIGHNPGLQEFAVLLAGQRGDALAQRLADAYPTGALAQLEIDSWAKVGPGSGSVTRFVTPRELRQPPDPFN
jgi:phosphohistidine phosphatase